MISRLVVTSFLSIVLGDRHRWRVGAMQFTKQGFLGKPVGDFDVIVYASQRNAEESSRKSGLGSASSRLLDMLFRASWQLSSLVCGEVRDLELERKLVDWTAHADLGPRPLEAASQVILPKSGFAWLFEHESGCSGHCSLREINFGGVSNCA
jgi:hypothetical protein